MTQDFDFFLLLSALALILVIWLMVRAVKGCAKGNSSLPPKVKEAPRRVERVTPRSKEPSHSEKEQKQPHKITTLYFTTKDDQPFAVIRLSTIGAQVWGNESIELPTALTRFIDRFLPRDEGESLLIHLVSPLPSDTALYASRHYLLIRLCTLKPMAKTGSVSQNPIRSVLRQMTFLTIKILIVIH